MKWLAQPPAVISAEGPSFCVGLDHQRARTSVRSIFTILAAAPVHAAKRSEDFSFFARVQKAARPCIDAAFRSAT